MTDIKFRLIFEKLDQNVELHKLSNYLKEKTGLDEGRTQDMLTDPPRILLQAITPDDGKKIQTALKKMGCQTYPEQIITDASYPFYISHHTSL